MSDYRLWFWSRENPRPRVVAVDRAESLVGAAVAMFAPVADCAWARDNRDGQLYVTRGAAGYCCEPVDGVGPAMARRAARERLRLGVRRRVRL